MDRSAPCGWLIPSLATVLLGGSRSGRLPGGHIDLGAAGTPNNRLLVAVQQASGLESESFDEAKARITTGSLNL